MQLKILLRLVVFGILITSVSSFAQPTQEGAAWALFRYDAQNTGHSGRVGEYTGDEPWFFQTGKGIFSTPVIDRDGTIYVGSADHIFYALSPAGEELWRFETGEIIDSAGAIPHEGLLADEPSILVPSGDGYLYHLRTDPGIEAPEERVIWAFDSRVSGRDSYNNWFEGNVALAPDGTIYAGNTNFNYYAINPDGSLKWVYETGSNNWSMAAQGEDGTIYWGSNDTNVRAVSPAGEELWKLGTIGFIAASAALGSDGSVYIGSFDSQLYAYTAEGAFRWYFKTDDHIYASVALGKDAEGQTNALYFGSTDGRFYALDTEGRLLWEYDTGDAIRSSAAIAYDSEGHEIVYFGAGNGKLYALNAADGTRRWSFDTTPEDPILRDRNDLNGSVALGETGVYIGGEHGQVWYVPFDYCLTAEDSRCSTDPKSDLPNDFVGMVYVTPGGSLVLDDSIPELPTGTMITLRLLVRENGQTLDYFLCNEGEDCPLDSLTIEADFPFEVEKSADTVYLHIRPTELLQADTAYTLRLAGTIYGNGRSFGNQTSGGEAQGTFEDEFSFRTMPIASGADSVTAIEWTRLAIPIPPMMPSLNQIGFDYMDWIIAPVMMQDEQVVLWAIGGRRNAEGRLVADPTSDFTLPLSGTLQNGDFILQNQDFQMAVTGIPVSFEVFELRGRWASDGVFQGATTYAEADAGSIPTFGPLLIMAGLANSATEKLVVAGTYITRPYEDGANLKPEGVEVGGVREQNGQIEVTLAYAEGASYPAIEHKGGIVLVNRQTMRAIPMDYHANLSQSASADGNLESITLRVPAGVSLAEETVAIVILDVYPLAEIELEN